MEDLEFPAKGKLKLSLELNDRVIIDQGSIIIKYESLHRRQIKLSIEAPLDISIDREKVYKKKYLDNEEGYMNNGVGYGNYKVSNNKYKN